MSASFRTPLSDSGIPCDRCAGTFTGSSFRVPRVSRNALSSCRCCVWTIESASSPSSTAAGTCTSPGTSRRQLTLVTPGFGANRIPCLPFGFLREDDLALLIRSGLLLTELFNDLEQLVSFGAERHVTVSERLQRGAELVDGATVRVVDRHPRHGQVGLLKEVFKRRLDDYGRGGFITSHFASSTVLSPTSTVPCPVRTSKMQATSVRPRLQPGHWTVLPMPLIIRMDFAWQLQTTVTCGPAQATMEHGRPTIGMFGLLCNIRVLFVRRQLRNFLLVNQRARLERREPGLQLVDLCLQEFFLRGFRGVIRDRRSTPSEPDWNFRHDTVDLDVLGHVFVDRVSAAVHEEPDPALTVDCCSELCLCHPVLPLCWCLSND